MEFGRESPAKNVLFRSFLATATASSILVRPNNRCVEHASNFIIVKSDGTKNIQPDITIRP